MHRVMDLLMTNINNEVKIITKHDYFINLVKK